MHHQQLCSKKTEKNKAKLVKRANLLIIEQFCLFALEAPLFSSCRRTLLLP